jgi:NAD(P)H-hydrate epimerase
MTQASDLTGDAKTMYRRFVRATGRSGVHVCPAHDRTRTLLESSDLIVDALLGTGLSAPATGPYRTTIEAINDAGRPVIAVDLPSGIHADTGAVLGTAVRAALTITFGLPKLGLYVGAGIDHAGEVHVADIGIPPRYVDAVESRITLLTMDSVRRLLPKRIPSAHKGTYGHVGLIAGSVGKTGAAALAAAGALRAGAGLVTVATAASQPPIVAGLVVEAMTAPLAEGAPGFIGQGAWDVVTELVASRDAVAVGPGVGLDAETQELVRRLVVEGRVPTVIDADGLTALAGHLDILRSAPAPRCLTPHPGEMARLLGASVAEVQRDRIAVARDFATSYRAHVVLKGAVSVIAAPDGTVLLNPTGNPGMASGGTGDVLTGVVGALLARGLAPSDALASAVYLHGLAGDIAAARVGEESLIARDVVAALPEAFLRLA